MDAHIQVLHLTERVKSLEYGLQEVLETHQINDKSASEDFVLFLIDGNRFQVGPYPGTVAKRITQTRSFTRRLWPRNSRVAQQLLFCY